MEKIINETAPKLKEQLANLANQIRQGETDVLALKEGYLKVQGAIELLEFLQKENSKADDTKSLEEAL